MPWQAGPYTAHTSMHSCMHGKHEDARDQVVQLFTHGEDRASPWWARAYMWRTIPPGDLSFRELQLGPADKLISLGCAMVTKAVRVANPFSR